MILSPQLQVLFFNPTFAFKTFFINLHEGSERIVSLEAFSRAQHSPCKSGSTLAAPTTVRFASPPRLAKILLVESHYPLDAYFLIISIVTI